MNVDISELAQPSPASELGIGWTDEEPNRKSGTAKGKAPTLSNSRIRIIVDLLKVNGPLKVTDLVRRIHADERFYEAFQDSSKTKDRVGKCLSDHSCGKGKDLFIKDDRFPPNWGLNANAVPTTTASKNGTDKQPKIYIPPRPVTRLIRSEDDWEYVCHRVLLEQPEGLTPEEIFEEIRTNGVDNYALADGFVRDDCLSAIGEALLALEDLEDENKVFSAKGRYYPSDVEDAAE